MDIDITHRMEVPIIGLGIGFLVIGLFVLPLILTGTKYDEYNLFLQLFNTYSIGVVYILFGLAIIGWRKRTQSQRIPFGVAVLTSVIAIIAILGIWVFVLLPVEPYSQAETLSDYLERAAFSPVVWIGCNLAWMITYNFASSLYQRLFTVAGIAVLPLIVSMFGLRMAREVREVGGAGAGLGYAAAMFIVILSLITIPLVYIYALPFYHLKKNESLATAGD